ncbi:hypothetical protein ASG22_16225 [Chryseobacterium sp. Leaf405]|uniref:cyclophilin-like fold protein n=1 Tax=Chryseobacterium sp. Leaf405 TaxID=1736367 RepID=UPI0006F51DB8|nr:cyclophilin-like fold protein [Chryseobacterium sp. Leaf405]KQT20963.1 hypothetical protein ASG22_16225 [Chryseobacterium sp. Leaf405]
MKSIAVLFAVMLTFSCCAASCSKEDEATPAQNNGNHNNNPNPIGTKMKITIGTAVFTATLYDNASGNAFKALLPLNLNMTELNSNEKYYDLPNSLPTNPAVGGAIKAGDLMLYGSNTLVLFYKNFNTSYSYSRLGLIDNPAGLEAALGNGNVLVKFEIN